MWYGFAFRAALWLSALFWYLNAVDDHDWFGAPNLSWLKDAKYITAQISLGLSFVVGYSIYSWAAPFLGISSQTLPPNIKPSQTAAIISADGSSGLQILGYSNVHGTRYFPLISLWASTIILHQKPLGGGAIALQVWQILSLFEALSATKLLSSSLGPLTLALLGSQHFFATGHQAALSSIQWDSAFIAVRTLRLPWSGFSVTLNTLGAQIVVAIAVPCLALWRAPARKRDLLGDVARASAKHMAFHATVALATCMWAMHLRRHLMLYRVFCPRFLLAAVVLVVVDLVVVIVGVGGTKFSFLSVEEIFEG